MVISTKLDETRSIFYRPLRLLDRLRVPEHGKFEGGETILGSQEGKIASSGGSDFIRESLDHGLQDDMTATMTARRQRRDDCIQGPERTNNWGQRRLGHGSGADRFQLVNRQSQF